MNEFIILSNQGAQGTLCSICPEPGACCKLFDTSATYWNDAQQEEVDRYMAEQFGTLPWRAVRPGSESWKNDEGREYSFWLFTCPKLSKEGRCTIYESRPKGCRNFVPASHSICVFHKAAAA